MPKRTTAADSTEIHVVIVTLDAHIARAMDRARETLTRELPGLTLSLHTASDWEHDDDALERCKSDIASGDIVIVNMLFMEHHSEPIMPALRARRDECDCMVNFMSSSDVVRLTRIGRFDMSASQGGPMALIKRLKERSKKGKNQKSSGAKQMAMLRRLPQILRFVPGTAQDARAYFLAMQYWLGSSEQTMADLVRFLINRYAAGPRAHLRGQLDPGAPVEYPDTGVYHPRLPERISEHRSELPRPGGTERGTVGLLVMRSYVLSGDTGHYDGVIDALEARGYRVVPAFASGLDARESIERYFIEEGETTIDALVSLTGFSLVGGPAYNDAGAAEEILARLDVPYLCAQAVEFQSLERWQDSDRGLTPIEATMMVAIPEIDGATAPMVYGGRRSVERDMRPHPERVATLADRVDRLVQLRHRPRAERHIAIGLFSFPPNAGNVGTAAQLAVFASLYHTLEGLAAAGYTVELPESIDALRRHIVEGNAEQFGTCANVHARIPADDHVSREPYLAEIEAQWGSAPGKHLSDGRNILVLGARFGNVLIAVQPGMGYEGDPMKLLFDKGFTPNHAFSAFYRYLREDFAADAILHFGTHGALEFMPGKQAGMTEACWPERLIGSVPNLYLYAGNNPSEGTIAKRRSSATLVSYLTPSLARAGLYRGLIDLKGSLDRWRQLDPDSDERPRLAELIQAQAAELDLVEADPVWGEAADEQISGVVDTIHELEHTLIPEGLHVVGEVDSAEARAEQLGNMGEASTGTRPDETALAALATGSSPEQALDAAGVAKEGEPLAQMRELSPTAGYLSEDHELPALIRALEGRFIRPAPGGDMLHNPDVLPTGRNMHGFDPFRIPSRAALAEGGRQAATLLDRHANDGNGLPESIALVLWGTDNLKSEGNPISQALALMGTQPRFDGYGRICGAELISIEALGRPRIDVVMTLSGIFRDLLPLQTRMLAEAAHLAAAADEPLEHNFIRRNALAYQREHGCDLETAALRVFSNADGVYGSNVNYLLDSGNWDDEDELAETYTQRKCYAYGRDGRVEKQSQLLNQVLGGVELSYQNLDSVELGVTTINHYFDTLGGISRAAKRASGKSVPVYIGDQTRGDSKVRTLGEQVSLETRTRMLNPKWHEGMLEHGYEGVRQIEEHLTNTMGWSATTGQVAPWVYQRISQTFVLDDAMRERLGQLNPAASARMANRLLEAQERNYWAPDEETLDALRRAGAELEDQLEGIHQEATA